MKNLLFIVLFSAFSFQVNAQFRATRDVVNFLCEKPFYDYYKENKIIFKKTETVFAGTTVRSLSVYVNDKFQGQIGEKQIEITPGSNGCFAELYGRRLYHFRVTSTSSFCTNKWYGGIIQFLNNDFFGFNFSEMVREGSKWPE